MTNGESGVLTSWVILMAAAAAEAPSAPTMFAPGVISAPIRVTSPTFSPDGGTVIVERATVRRRELVQSHKVDGRWSDPEPIPIDDRYTAIEPALAADGSYLLYASNRPLQGTAPLDGRWDGKLQPARGGLIWRIDRGATGWGTPRPLGPEVNRGNSNFEPVIAASGNLYFMRSGEDGEFHVFVAKAQGDGYREAEPLPFTRTGIGDIDATVAADESFLIFGSNRERGGGDNRLFISFRRGDAWTDPVLLPGAFNGGAPITEPRLADRDRTLYFTQNRAIWSVDLAPSLAAVRAGKR